MTNASRWVDDVGGDLPIYVRAMAATIPLEQCAALVRDLKRQHAHLVSAAKDLQRFRPEFVFSIGALALPRIDARTMAIEIVQGGLAVSKARGEVDDVGLLAAFLEQVFKAQCDEATRLVWIPRLWKGARDAVASKLGDDPCEREQIARLVADGIGRILELRPLQRVEVPIVAVASGVEAPATHSGEALRKEFERRADAWRQKPRLVAERLRTLTLGLVPLAADAFAATMGALFAGPVNSEAVTAGESSDAPHRRYFDENGRLVSTGRLLPND